MSTGVQQTSIAYTREKMASNNRWLAKARSFVVISGASRGLGRVLAIKLAAHLGDDSVILLIARDPEKLNETRNVILSERPGIKVATRSIDLSIVAPAERDVTLINSVLNEFSKKSSDFEQAIIVHNAGTMGRMANGEDLSDAKEWADYLYLNLTSPVCLNAAFLKIFTATAVQRRLIINITSGFAVRPIPSAAFYITGKCARDAFFKTLALEDASVKVLNYAPGPLQTDLNREVSQKITHPAVKELIQKMISSGRMLTCEMTLIRLLDILEKDTFESGCWIDYFDK